MDALEQVFYLPSLRCNLRCIHCGQSRDLSRQENELDCGMVFSALENSCMLQTKKIGIAGGEPFLNETLGDALCDAMESTSLRFETTTNGYYWERIRRLAEAVRPEDRSRLAFNISIDGTEEMHNCIRQNELSWRNAVRSAGILLEKGFFVNIQCVIQKDNVEHVEEIKSALNERLPGAHLGLLPLVVECSDRKEPFLHELLWRHVFSPRDKLRLLSEGKWGLREYASDSDRGVASPCHAGEKNIAIGPDGEVYTCLTGAFYKCQDQHERRRYCLGDLKERTLDEIWIGNVGALLPGVASCDGCTNLCEVDREVDLFGKRIDLESPQVISSALSLERDWRIGDAVLNYESWHGVESGDGRRWAWSREHAARMFVGSGAETKQLCVKCAKLTEEQRVKLIVDGREMQGSCHGMECEFRVTVQENRKRGYHTLQLMTDRLRSPREAGLGEDDRRLGVCLTEARCICP